MVPSSVIISIVVIIIVDTKEEDPPPLKIQGQIWHNVKRPELLHVVCLKPMVRSESLARRSFCVFFSFALHRYEFQELMSALVALIAFDEVVRDRMREEGVFDAVKVNFKDRYV